MRSWTLRGRALTFLALAGVLGPGGCTRYEARPLQPQESLAAFEARTLSDPNLVTFLAGQRGTVDPNHVWTVADLTLAAFFFQPALATARAEWTVAVAETGEAGQYPNPSLGLAPAFNTSTPADAGISSWILGVGLDVPVDWPAQRRARLTEARSRSQAAWLSVLDAAWQTRVEVRAAMVALYAARARLHLQASRVTLQEQRVQLIEGLHRAGAVDRPAVDALRQDLGAGRLSLTEAQQAEAEAVTRLAAAVGVPAGALRDLPLDRTSWETLPPGIPVRAVCRQALLNRTDVLGQLAVYEAAQARLQGEVARQMPDLALGPAYEFDQDDNKWGLNLSLTLPVFHQNQAAIETARRRRAVEGARFNALQARVLVELDQARARVEYTLRRYHQAETLYQAEQKRVATVGAQVRAGAASRADRLTAEISLLDRARQRLDARVEAQAAFGQLEQAMQSPADLPAWREAVSASPDSSEDPHEG